MASISTVIFYILTFLSLYVQVFFLLTFLENRKKIVTRHGPIKLSKYPSVTIVVPSWNEELTIYKTVRSLLNLNYPKEKLKIFLIDDGSTDGTWNVIQKFAKYSNVKVFQKENGGKYTALNLGLGELETDFMGCLDADSLADTESLVRIMSFFEKDPTIMAVVPSVVVHEPQNMVQKAQGAEYNMGVYVKKMLGFAGAIHVTPGPLTIFKKKVFDDLGPYRHAHNTEDMEIAYRMQKHHYKIEHCHDAYVYTNTPKTIRKLFKQRLRWIYGFINNTIDYREVLLNAKYGNFALFTVPASVISLFAVAYLFTKTVFNLVEFLVSKILVFKTVGFHVTNTNYFDPFFINTQAIIFMVIILNVLVLFSIMLGRKMAEGKWGLNSGVLYFFLIFTIVGPFWLLSAIYNTILSGKKPAWR